MSTFVLVHGAWHGAWCWYKVVALLEARGHRAIAPDLPGHGVDRTPLPEVTLEAYAERVCTAIAAQDEPVILVGHSMGGRVITAAAERSPERIATLVYLTAILPQDGQSMLEATAENPDTALADAVLIDEAAGVGRLREGSARDVFYGRCPEQDVALARLALIEAQPLEPMNAPISAGEERFGSVPRAYIECLQDRALGIPLQRRMQAALPCQQSYSLDTDHSPFFSMPEELVEHLRSIAQR